MLVIPAEGLPAGAIEHWPCDAVAVHALVERRNRHRPTRAAGLRDRRAVRAGCALDGLFEQTVEEHAPGSRVPAVEAEAELVEIGRDQGRLHRSLVGGLDPAFGEGGDTMNSGTQLVSLVAGSGDRGRTVYVVGPAGRRVALETVGEHHRARLDAAEQKRPQRRSARVADDLHATPPEALGSPLDSDLDQDLSERATARDTRLWPSEEGLVGLDGTREPVSPGTDHRTAVAMQHRPGRLGGTDLEHALQTERRDTLLVARHGPYRGEPHRERGPRSVEDRPCRRRQAPGTAAARPTPVVKQPPDHLSAHREQKPSGHLSQSRPVSASGNQASTSP